MKRSIVGLVAILFLVNEAFAQTDIYLSGAAKLLPIAVPQLCQEAAPTTATKEIPNTIGRDLDLSGYFEVLSPSAYIESPGKCGGPESMTYSDWTVIGADHVVKGNVSVSGSRLRARMWLVDVIKQQAVLGKEYEAGANDASMVAHRFANEILKYFTGSYGPFGTQIAFSTKVGRFKEIAIMDMDGGNLRQLTNERSLATSVSWAPNGKSLIFTSYRARVPDLFTIDIFNRSIKNLTNNADLELSPHYMRNGTILASINEGNKDSHLVILDGNGRMLRRITSGSGVIDVSGQWSPDESQIVFCSNRGGGPQIYVMNANGSDVHRISFVSSNYCTSPAWSPKGDKITFICRADAGFNVFVSAPDGSNPMQLTSYGDNEDPTWSPDGRYIAFSSTLGKGVIPSIALIRADGAGLKQITKSRSGDYNPAWGPGIE
ncbi:MAG: hypothetical protein GYA55_13445 [SAR324 cluster bacterium]|uniref:TolB N-terminal domain-containing protein n=1 Tax=SAR324 cluster bacterium TaxID=2024889 RepID=A0A7X9FTR8_9DELT|nr:hypothetical protein [SAR324 cluster bacterium]